MGFLAPGVFILGAALLVALLASYLLRPRRPVRRISSTFLWLAALHELEAQRPWRRVPPTLLLIIQIAALAAMVGAIARPFTLSTQSTGPFTIVLLDAEASMQATDVQPSRFESARTKVSQLIDALEPGQELAIVNLDAQPHILSQPATDHVELKKALASAQPTTQAANLPAALSLAGSLAEGHADAELVIIADGSLDRLQVPRNFKIPIRYVGVGTANAANLTVAGLATRVTDGRLSALARVTNSGKQPAASTLTLKIDGNRFDARTVHVDANGTATEQWDDLPAAAHILEARLETPDHLALDDAAWAVVAGDRPTRVLLVSDGNVFTERALALRPSTQVTRVSPADYVPQAHTYDLIVLDGFVPPVLPSGASVLLLHPPLDNGLLSVGPDVNVSGVSASRQADPLLADVPLDGVHVSQARRLTTPAWADTVLAAPETPLLLVGEQAGHRIGVFGFDVHQSDLPLQPAFPVLVQHLLDWLVPRASTATPVVQVGDSVALSPLPETVSLSLVPPGGQPVQVGPPFPPQAFTDTTLPGVYQVVQRDAADRETTSSFAVNFVNATESRLVPGADSGVASVNHGLPVRAPHEFWEALALVGLLLLALELALAWWQFTTASLRARLALGLRIAMAGLLALALLGVGLPQIVTRQATVFVTDTSASTQSLQPAMAEFVRQATAAKGPDDVYAVVDTARTASLDHPLSTVPLPDAYSLASEGGSSADALAATGDSGPGANAAATDLAGGLRLAADVLPTGYRQRVVLLSDGQETTGNAVAQARALHARGIQVDALPLVPISSPEVLLENVSTPQTVSEGERFSIGVRVDSNVQTDATLHVLVNGQSIVDQPVSLTTGATDLAFSAQAPQAGLLSVQATVDANQDTLHQNNTAYAVVEVQGPPRVLIAEGRPGEADAIASALTSSGMRLDRIAATDLPDQTDALGNYQSIVLADVSAKTLTDAQQNALRAYVRDLGRGLVALGGDTSFGQGDYIGTPLDDLLPVRSSVRSHRDQGRVALMLVIDTSGSMSDDVYHEGTTKLDMAKQAAVLSAQQLSPRDQVGIMTFDSNQHWVMPLSPVLGMPATAIQDRLAPLTADGGTDIFPALSSAFDAINQSDARYKHIILMTDGMSCCGGDYASLQERMRAADVTLSTIAIGGDADTDLLSQLAKQGDGRYYFAEHARDIPRLTTRETDLATRGPLVEGDITPRQVSPDSTLSGLGSLPHLGGYLVTSPKDLAEVLLVSDAADPLLARWQYGLGRAVAWTSDLRGRWSQDWLQWSGTPQLFNSLVNWTIAPASGPLRLSLRADAASGYVTVSESTPAASPGEVHAHVVQPDGSSLEMTLSAIAPGEYAASFPLSGSGTYLVHVDENSVGQAEAGLPVSYPGEFRQVSADTRRMQQIAAAGGGHVVAAPKDAFADDLPPLTTPLPLQRIFVLIAAILLPLEVAIRRLRVSPADVLGWLRHPHRLAIQLPRWSPEIPEQSPGWLPGAMRKKQVPPPLTWPPHPAELALRGHATPGLARDTATDDSDDALAAATAWLRSRRTTTGDKG